MKIYFVHLESLY